MALWVAYATEVSGKPAVIHVDLELEERAPDPALPWRIELRFALRDPTADGVAGREEGAAIEAALHKLATAMAARNGGVLLGALLRDRRAHAFFQAPSEEGVVDALRDAAPGFIPPYSVASLPEPDPEWLFFRELLLPDDQTLEKIVEEARKAGGR